METEKLRKKITDIELFIIKDNDENNLNKFEISNVVLRMLSELKTSLQG